MQRQRAIIYIAGFIFSIPLALTSYINSSFLESYTDAYHVGIIYIIASVLTIASMLGMPKMLDRIGNRRTTLSLGLVVFLSFILLAFGNNKLIIVLSFLLYFISTSLIIASLDIFIEDFSRTSAVGKFRGFYLMFINSAWVLAQMISGGVLARSSYRGIYLLSGGFMVLFAVIFVLFLKDFKDPKYKRVSVFKTAKFFLQNKNISTIYLINLILKFFYAWMVIYSPIYLHEYLGFGWDKIGIIFTIMLTAFFLEYPLGKLSDKIGEKKILKLGFLIAGFFTLFIPFISEPRLWILAGIFFGTRVGAAMIEVMSESYFFKIISEENADAINFFRNTAPLSYIIGPLLAIPLLLYVPSFNYLFYILGAIMLGGFLLTLRLRDIR